MRLRPRYSLFSLLILTALVAGGMKLWHGPHHVVERPGGIIEDEFTFTRNWDGNKTILGPHVRRFHFEQCLYLIHIEYYCQGINSCWYQQIDIDPLKKEFFAHPLQKGRFYGEVPLELLPEEQLKFALAVERELAALRALDHRPR